MINKCKHYSIIQYILYRYAYKIVITFYVNNLLSIKTRCEILSYTFCKASFTSCTLIDAWDRFISGRPRSELAMQRSRSRCGKGNWGIYCEEEKLRRCIQVEYAEHYIRSCYNRFPALSPIRGVRAYVAAMQRTCAKRIDAPFRFDE